MDKTLLDQVRIAKLAALQLSREIPTRPCSPYGELDTDHESILTDARTMFEVLSAVEQDMLPDTRLQGKTVWMSEADHAKFPFYRETMERLRAVLQLAQEQGMTGPEFASITASLHAEAIARLNPNPQRLEQAVEIFRVAVLTIQADLLRMI